MEVTYFLNWMGPLNSEWIKTHGEQWSLGRIDIDGIPDEPYGREYSIPAMLTSDWRKLGQFLFQLNTDRILSFSEIISLYEKSDGTKITWLNK